ncbi:MAG TPA: transferrin receptor-like dimerization domain-containing protein [Rhizomicrobium sp.]|jgi:N-acetylated-alpha-linked acidic dipeptidase
MKRRVLAGLAVLLLGTSAQAQGPDLLTRFDSQISSKDQTDWLKLLAAEPNQVGSPHDKFVADWIVKQFKSWGWDTRVETFQVLFPTPISEAVEMGDFKATLTEKPIPGDSTARFKDYELPAYLAYQGDGDVNAPLVYVNYGTEADYKQLALEGVSVEGKIVIARYGQVWRGVKPLLAAKHGAIGCLIYSDPADDGYAVGDAYPKGPMRPPQGIQRGSAMDMMLYPGDPLTPGIPATANAKRLTHETAGSIVKIPALPISYADAQVLLSAMDGPVAPRNWRGALPITYRVGPGTKAVHLMVKSNWDLKPVYDVIATIKGSEYPDQWVVRGNHHDGWVAGASDPESGQVALLDEARALGGLLKSGWRPKRTIVYTSWDGEEPMLLGSTEWVEQHMDDLKKKAVIYINTDGNSKGFLNASGSQDLGAFVTGVARGVTDPTANVSVAERARDRLLTNAARPEAGAEIKAAAKAASSPASSLPMGAAGSGSDFSGFLDHAGVTTLSIGFGGEGEGGGVYHSAYDTFEHHTNFDDPGMVYGKVLAETVGHSVIAAADADMPLQRPAAFATYMASYTKRVENLADDARAAAEQQKALLAANAYTIVGGDMKGAPVPRAPVPAFDFKPLDAAVATLKDSADKYEAAAKGDLSPDQKKKVLAIMRDIDATLLDETGLPGRPWYKNLIYAPGRYIGYGVTTMPGITESITEERFDDVPRYIGMTAAVLKAYAARLDQATAVMTSKS